MPRSRRSLGSDAEDRAAAYLIDSGFTMITRRFHARGGEIDLICIDADDLVFVEVKSRASSLPEEAFTARKSSRMRAAARAYLNSVGESERAFRFDLIAVDASGLRHYRNVDMVERATLVEVDSED